METTENIGQEESGAAVQDPLIPDIINKRKRETEENSENKKIKHNEMVDLSEIVSKIVTIRETYAPRLSYAEEERSSRGIVNGTGHHELSIKMSESFDEKTVNKKDKSNKNFEPVIEINFTTDNRRNSQIIVKSLENEENLFKFICSENGVPLHSVLLLSKKIYEKYENQELLKELFISRKFALIIVIHLPEEAPSDVPSDPSNNEFEEFYEKLKNKLTDPFIIDRNEIKAKEMFIIKLNVRTTKTYRFKEIYKSPNETYKWRLENLICKHVNDVTNKRKITNIVQDLIKAEIDDEQIYDRLHHLFHNEAFGTRLDEGWASNRGSSKADEIIKFLPRGFRPGNFLDVGCAEGSITGELGAALHLPPERVHGCDIRDIPSNDKFTFRLIDSSEDNQDSLLDLYKDVYDSDGGFDFIAVQMCLHHIVEKNKIQNLLNQIYKLLKKDGILLIKEHDSDSKYMDYLLDIFHGMYARVWSDPPETLNFCGTYSAYYRSRAEWDDVLDAHDFVRLRGDYARPVYNNRRFLPNPYHIYVDTYEKKGGQRYHQQNERAYLPPPRRQSNYRGRGRY